MINAGENVRATCSDLALCLQSLAETGRAAVSPVSSEIPDADAIPLLEKWDAAAREELALELPPFSAEAALWGARLFHQLCRFVICRDMGEDQVNAACAVPCPWPRNPSTDWSVDLTLRHLPRLFQMARQLSNADPLVERLREIAVAWPLSSVGVAGLQGMCLDSFVGDAGLRRLYSDRIFETGDTSRLGDERLDEALRADLGIHRELAPILAGKLFGNENDTD
jgi:hypothetical protein